MTATGPVQQAFYDRMTGDAALMDLITGVFDHVPEGTPHPYVVLGEATEVPDKAHGLLGWQTTETLHIWSRSRGFSEALDILALVTELFDEQTLTVPGRHFVSCRLEFAQTLTDPNPEIRHIPVRFRVTTEEEQ